MKILITFMLGSFFGVWVMCCMVAAGRADEQIEKKNEDRTD